MRAYPNCGNRDNTNSGGDVNTPALFLRTAAVGGFQPCLPPAVGGRSITAGGRGIGDA